MTRKLFYSVFRFVESVPLLFDPFPSFTSFTLLPYAFGLLLNVSLVAGPGSSSDQLPVHSHHLRYECQKPILVFALPLLLQSFMWFLYSYILTLADLPNDVYFCRAFNHPITSFFFSNLHSLQIQPGFHLHFTPLIFSCCYS